MNIYQKTAGLLSYLFHPLLMPIFGMFFIFTSGTYLSLIPVDAKKAILLIVALSTVLLPLSVLPFLYYQKIISNYAVHSRGERLTPLFITSGFYFFSYFILRKLSAPIVIQHFILGAFGSLLIASVINIKYKISLHMIGLGGLIGLISYFGYLYNANVSTVLCLAILTTGITGSARLILGSHTQNQIYSGFLAGFFITFTIMFLANIYALV